MNQVPHKRPVSAGGFAKKFASTQRPRSAGGTCTVRNQYDDLGNDRKSRTAHVSRDVPSGRIRSISAHSRKGNTYTPSPENNQDNEHHQPVHGYDGRQSGRTPRALRDRVARASQRRNSDSASGCAHEAYQDETYPKHEIAKYHEYECSNTQRDENRGRQERPKSASAGGSRGHHRSKSSGRPAWNQTYGAVKKQDRYDGHVFGGVYDDNRFIYRAHATNDWTDTGPNGHGFHRPVSPTPGIALQQKIKRAENSLQRKRDVDNGGNTGSPRSRSPSPVRPVDRSEKEVKGEENLEGVFEHEVRDEENEQSLDPSWGPLISPSVLHVNQKYVMPCLKSDDIILSETVSRLRKTALVRNTLERHIEAARIRGEEKEIKRLERLALAHEQMALQKKQKQLMVMMILAMSGAKFKSKLPRLNAACFQAKKKQSVMLRKASIDLIHSFDFEERLLRMDDDAGSLDNLEARLEEFLELLERQLWRFQVAINILQKRVAVRIIKVWYKELHTIPKVIILSNMPNKQSPSALIFKPLQQYVLLSCLTTKSYYQILLPSLSIIFYYHLLLSHLTIISYYHILLSSLTITSYYHLLLSCLTTKSYYHLFLSYFTITCCYHLLLSPLTIISYYQILLSPVTFVSYYYILLPFKFTFNFLFSRFVPFYLLLLLSDETCGWCFS
jgi:hypothetical protein